MLGSGRRKRIAHDRLLSHGSGGTVQARPEHGRGTPGALSAGANGAGRPASQPRPATPGAAHHGGASGFRRGRAPGGGGLGPGPGRTRAAGEIGRRDRARCLACRSPAAGGASMDAALRDPPASSLGRAVRADRRRHVRFRHDRNRSGSRYGRRPSGAEHSVGARIQGARSRWPRLGPLRSRVVRYLVAASGPWIRMFPASRALDGPARSLPSAIIDAATTFLRGAAQARLLRDDAAAVVRAVLEDADHLGPFAEKARNWAILTASNLGISMLLVLGATARAYENATGAVESLEVARRIERIVLQHEARLRQLFAQLPDDVGNELQMAIDAIRASAADDV